MTSLRATTTNSGCWFAQNLPDAGVCEGRLVRCHLLPRSLFRREFPQLRRAGLTVPLYLLLTDPRAWVLGCGGIMGPGGHHGLYKPDGPRPIPRELIPPDVEEMATELGLGWYLDRTYGVLEDEQAA